MTRKDVYVEMLNFFVSRNCEGHPPLELKVDDDARGHNGTDPDNFLATMHHPCHRARIQGRCTPYVQPADTTWANKELNRMLRDEMREEKVAEAIAGKEPVYFSSMTLEGREYFGSFLHRMKAKWNADKDKREGVKTAFRRTLLLLNENNTAKTFSNIIVKYCLEGNCT